MVFKGRQRDRIRIIFIALVLIMLGASVYFRIRFDRTGINMKKTAKDANSALASANAIRKISGRDQRRTSIATFFLSSPLIGSVEIFESWQGKYKFEEKSDTAKFMYAGRQGEQAMLFSVRSMPAEEWKAIKGKDTGLSFITEAERRVFAYSAIKADSPELKKNSELKKMAEDIPSIIKTFRYFKP